MWLDMACIPKLSVLWDHFRMTFRSFAHHFGIMFFGGSELTADEHTGRRSQSSEQRKKERRGRGARPRYPPTVAENDGPVGHTRTKKTKHTTPAQPQATVDSRSWPRQQAPGATQPPSAPRPGCGFAGSPPTRRSMFWATGSCQAPCQLPSIARTRIAMLLLVACRAVPTT